MDDKIAKFYFKIHHTKAQHCNRDNGLQKFLKYSMCFIQMLKMKKKYTEETEKLVIFGELIVDWLHPLRSVHCGWKLSRLGQRGGGHQVLHQHGVKGHRY